MMKSETIQHRSSMTISSISIALWLLVVVGCKSGQVEGSSSSRCAVLCNIPSMRDECERCKFRVPMRFGKRSSPPQYMLELTEVGEAGQQQPIESEANGVKQLIDDELAEEIFNYLVRPQRQLRAKRTIEGASVNTPMSLHNTLFRNYVTSDNTHSTNIRLKKHLEEIS